MILGILLGVGATATGLGLAALTVALVLWWIG